MLAKSFMLFALVLKLSAVSSFAGDDPWFFNPEAIANAYRYQRQFGARLHNPIEPHDCDYGHGEFTTVYRGKSMTVPCGFIRATKRQLREILTSGAARYLFPLDLGDARLAVPAAVYASKYAALTMDEILPLLLHEPTLMAIYQIRPDANSTLSSKGVREQRTRPKSIVIGHYNGRPNQSLAREQSAPGFVELGTFHLLEHFLGELTTIVEQRVVTFDLSFENDNTALPNKTAAR